MLIFNTIFSFFSALYILVRSREIIAAVFISFASYWLMVLVGRTNEVSSILEIFLITINLFYILTLRRFRLNSYEFFYLIFCLYALIYSAISFTSKGFILSVLSFGPLFFSVVMKKRQLSVDFVVCILVAMGFYIRIFNTVVYDLDFMASRYDSSVWGANSIGAVMLILNPFIKTRRPWLLLGIFILLSLSRGLIVTWVLQEMFLSIFKLRKEFKITYAIALISLIVTFDSSNRLWSEISFRFFGYEKPDLISAYYVVVEDERKNIGEASLDMWMERPIFGNGIGSFSRELEEYGYHSSFSNAHNMYLTILVELGITGLIVFFSFLFSMIKSVKDIGFRISIFTWMVYGLFSGEMYAEGLFLSFFPMYFVFYVAKNYQIHQPIFSRKFGD